MNFYYLDQLFSVLFSLAWVHGLINLSYHLSLSKFVLIDNKKINFIVTFLFIANLLSALTFTFSIYFGVNDVFIKYISFFILAVGFYKPFYFKEILLKNNSYLNKLIYFFLIGYFLLSISPITDNDSLDYHLTVPLYSLQDSKFFFSTLWPHAQLSGFGEALLMYGMKINAFHVGQIFQFISLLFLILFIDSVSQYKKFFIDYRNSDYISLAILSIPTLIFLCYTSKFQLFPLVTNFISLILAIYILPSLNNKKLIYTFSLLIFLIMSSTQMKFSFFLSSGLIGLYSINVMLKKKYFISTLFISILCFFLIVFPRELYEYLNFNKDIVYNFFNPVTDEYSAKWMNSSLKHGTGNSRIFPVWLFLPFNSFDNFDLGVVTTTLGISIFLFLFNIHFRDIRISSIIYLSLFFFTLGLAFAQPMGRFFLEPAIWLLFISGFYLHIKYNLFLKYFKKFLIFISVISSIIILIIGLYYNASYFSNKNFEKFMNNFSDGYTFYKWTNSVLPKNSKVISAHRSYSLSTNRIISYDFRLYLKGNDSKKFFIQELKKINPNYIIYPSYELNNNNDILKHCRGKLVMMKKSVGKITGRNPFNKNRRTYDGFIYEIDHSLLDKCIDYYN